MASLATGAQRASEPNRWAVLALLGTAQLMVVLDATIVNIALPSAQVALHFSTADREWIVTAYALAFGSLLLLGGKLGDLFGRKWTFVGGLIGFAVVSAIGGLAQNFAMLVSARALQGAFGAMLAPSALGLLTVTFADSPDRAKAFGIFGAIAGGGASVGLVLGGALTQLLSWRWCLYVNLVIAVPTAIFALRLLVNRRDPERGGIDVPGLLTASAGLFALVYGFSNAETQSWTATATIVPLVAAPVLLLAFVVIESRVKDPLLPLHIVRDRARGGAYLSVLLAAAGLFGVFFFLTYYMQLTLRFSPLTTGLAFLPMTGLLVATSVTAQTRVLPRTGAKPLVTAGMTLGVIAMIIFTRLSVDGAYATHVLPGLLVIGVGMGCIFAPAIGTATLGVSVRETGVASAMVNTSQQVGGAVGLALLSTVSASAATDYARSHLGVAGLAGLAAIHGYTRGFWWAAGIFAVGLVTAIVILPSKAGAHECSLRTALSRGVAYAHHLEATAEAAAHALRMSGRPLTQPEGPADRDAAPDIGDAPPGRA
ncbi:MAG TPA: MFS transporter [Solirubrobacteraceae bacterium]|nr:MFS transporter [Solirubrobacteraceae bacterium]